jgi:hypothetical protein
VGCWVKGCEVPCKVKTATMIDKTATMIVKSLTMIDKSKAVILVFRVERTAYGRCKDITNVKFIEKR